MERTVPRQYASSSSVPCAATDLSQASYSHAHPPHQSPSHQHQPHEPIHPIHRSYTKPVP
ncbi:hypothetical protein DAPPUDRAFT_273523 [Daphnia pulex]|uniref:Uncharacterized protein n=1 Tax=Daphnia pulex TaxID=6669 RepID=E9I3K1_DAPPU|nr:hypothetical protein DAPPUDRAFT_273523 [Daphnia pulex]|eukprot:EFX61429.1 hypothetical protein DAPPUDRAFT_273523 [Daphnia pulex]